MRRTVTALLAAAALLLASCGHMTRSPVGNPADEGETVLYTVNGESVDFGIYCSETAAGTLVPEKPLGEYTGTMGVIVSSMRFPYGGGTKVMAEETLEKYFPNMDYVIGNGDGAFDPDLRCV